MKDDYLANNTFENGMSKWLEDQLPVIDEILSNDQIHLWQRPFLAACYFVEYCIIDIEGDDTENFLEKKWFKTIYKLTRKWYQDRYADAIEKHKDDSALGVVLIYNTPFQLCIPIGIVQEKESNDKQWLCLPNSVLPEENVLDWITSQPNLNKMSKDELESLKNNISKISLLTRIIRVNLWSASLKNELCKISISIPAHIEKAINDILSLEDGRISTSFWEIHLSLEKSLKLLILQNGDWHKNEHNLKKLCKIVNNRIGLECGIFDKFPESSEAIRQRYGEGNSFTVQEAVDNYISAMEVIANLSGLLKRKFVFRNARFLCQIPTWAK